MDLHVLKTFVAVCEYNGFSSAAKALGYSQSTVSTQVKQLESELNVVLFDRIRHNTTMTSEGAIVLSYAKEILALEHELLDSLHVSDGIYGDLRLAMSDSVCKHYFTSDYLEFHRLYPNIKVHITSCGTKQMFEMLRKNEVDIVFTLDSHIYDSEFDICGESRQDLHFVVSSKHPLVKKDSLHITDLLDESFILTEKDMSYRKVLDSMLAMKSLLIKPKLEIGDPDQICNIIKDDSSISYLPDFITQQYVDNGSLVRLKVLGFDNFVWTQILIHKNKWKSSSMNAFIDFYKDILDK